MSTNGNGHSEGLDHPDSRFRVALVRGVPANLEAERGLLGSILIGPDVMPSVARVVSPRDFFREAHERVAAVFWRRFEAGESIDPILVDDELRSTHRFAPHEATQLVSELLESVPHSALAVEYAHVVRQKSISRDLLEVVDRLQADGYSDDMTSEEKVARAEGAILDLAEKLVRSDEPRDVTKVVEDVFARLDQRREGIVHGVLTGFAGVDGLIGCFRDANLAVLAARPAQGKTALALNIAEHVAFRQGIPTLFFSLEMEACDLAERFVSGRSGVAGQRLQDPARLTADEDRAIGAVRSELVAGRLAIDDSSERTVTGIGAVARLHKRRCGLGFVVIDYLSLIDGQPRKGESRQEEVARITRGIKVLARSLGVPILLLCQLNREVERRNGCPRLADLRESGQIEQEASVVLLLHRDLMATPGEAEIVVAKNRFGRTGSTRLTFRSEVTRFEEPIRIHSASKDEADDRDRRIM